MNKRLVVPTGVHKGKNLADLPDGTIHAMCSGWNGSDLRFDPFFEVLLAERERRRTSDTNRKTLRDEIAIAMIPEVLDHYEKMDWNETFEKCYELADNFIEARNGGSNGGE